MTELLISTLSLDYGEKIAIQFDIPDTEQRAGRKWGFKAQAQSHRIGSYPPITPAQVVHALRTIADAIEAEMRKRAPKDSTAESEVLGPYDSPPMAQRESVPVATRTTDV